MTADHRLRMVVADDEPIARAGLERLARGEDDVDVVAVCRSGDEALAAIRTHQPDVALLDIAMPTLSGVEVVRSLPPSHRPAIVFVTAFDRFAIEAFDMHAVDYVLKPFDEARFRTALARVRERLRAGDRERNARIDALLEALDRKPVEVDRLAVKQGDRVVLVSISDIDWCEADDNYIRIVVGSARYMVRDTMRSLEQRLGRGFARIHRSVIVNLSRVRELQPLFHGDYQVSLRDGTKLTLSRGYRDGVLARLGR